MSKSPNKAADFLKAMQDGEASEPGTSRPESATEAPAAARPVVSLQTVPKQRPAKAKATPRAELKHFGGYLDDETLEKIAVLRVRLKKDNSELIKLAIDDLHRKHTAKRAFGDA